mmetsp:Transcript_31151/g.47640  ORF Transcript_31151/g.47640 Transcript_31151/m.47640 type:complete len:139 (+) Transcript_31151:522-938(+)|eukprot:CAMPEP_0170499434 /NCGR_PEP_ID=MMETSP0208-20121228/31385_1 /TAXON_ID=197538 /ORGANISM="Strombidium inclinatum, Strain S3" /LENGTH=138 /DNA_ID=CAMNT_0010776973 /DNA_START=456 /DNA_END=872 /DNA_ORIENTATION=+
MRNPRERTSDEHLKLYDCYLDLVREAVTHDSKDMTDKHLYRVRNWFEFQVDGTDFRNKQRGSNAEALENELREEMEEIRLITKIHEREAQLSGTKKGSIDFSNFPSPEKMMVREEPEEQLKEKRSFVQNLSMLSGKSS